MSSHWTFADIIRFLGYLRSTVYDTTAKYIALEKSTEGSANLARVIRKIRRQRSPYLRPKAHPRRSRAVSEEMDDKIGSKRGHHAFGRSYILQNVSLALMNHLVQNWLSDNMDMFWPKEF